ncbi:MAG: aminoacetone oxidase family FAD-binding enzyme, partial [Lachnospiraceae bacterium]|nr:aminoacetone oxidase family FAD-binding enzyme [Lachnospiraceae bacterium]
MKVAVIGCGASGMMAAIAAAEAGATVTVFEKNGKPGKKLFITGKGRCNLTNDRGREDFFAHVRRNEKFLYSAYAAFDETAVQAFFTENGCHLKTERGGRVFPVSDKSSDIINVLTRRMKALGVTVRYDVTVRGLRTEEADPADAENTTDKLSKTKAAKRVSGLIVTTKNKEEVIETDAVILATGGLSYPSTGSTGDGYALAQSVGHTVTETTPSEVPLLIKERDCFELQGLSLRNVAMKLFGATDASPPGKPKKKRKDDTYEGFGEMLFAHFGVSGPLILAASSYYEAGTEALLSIDLKPALTFEELDARVLRDFEAAHNKQFQNA